MVTAAHEGKRFYSREDFGYEYKRSSGQSYLQTRIAEVIERQNAHDPQPGCSTSETLINGFIGHIWPEIRDDYHQMTHSLEEVVKKVLKERQIDAEVSSRVKEDVSIAKTLKRRQEHLLVHRGSAFNSYQDLFDELHDLSGLRIVLMDREHFNTAQKLIEELFQEQKPLAHFDPNREVGRFWKRPWFGAYETHNHRVQLANDNRAALGDIHQYSGVMFEIQLTTFSNNLYNKLAHDLLYKADPGLVTGQEEMVIDVSHGLARCFELCMRILRPKLRRDTNNMTAGTAEDFSGNTEREVKLAQSTVEDFERDLHNESESDRTAQLLRKLLSQKEDAKDQACFKDLLLSDPRDDKTRIEDTKGGLLPLSYNWILEDEDFQQWRQNNQKQPFWITGAPGKGKTMMLCGIIDELKKNTGTNVSFFYCQGTTEHSNTGTAVLRGLLFLLCKKQPSLIAHLRDKYDDAGGKLFEDTNAWYALSEIFSNILRDLSARNTYLIVDALDECLTDSRQQLATLILRMSSAYPAVKWIVSSRKLDEFKVHLQKATHLSLETRGQLVSAAVDAYIEFKVTKLGEQEFSHSALKRIASELKRKSEGTFLWVAIACEEIESAPEYEVMDILQEMPAGLNELYGKLVQDINSLKRKNPMYCQSILRAVALAFRPLTLKEVQELADLPRNVPAVAIAEMCRSLLTIRGDTVFFVHQSAKDYLSKEWDTVFQHSIRKTHESMFLRSVEAMEQTLRQDIYNLEDPGISIEDIQRPSPDPLVSIQYSCAHWITHLLEAQPYSAEDQVGGFLRIHFLHWFEALSLIRAASACAYALRDLVTLINKDSRFEPLLPLASDMYRFARSNAAIVEKAPLQAYSSALIFSPARSLTRKLFASKEPEWIVQKPMVDQHWNSSVTTLSGHLDSVNAVAFSPDGRHIISGSSDSTIKIWDTEIGAEALTAAGHTEEVWSVAFSPDGHRIVSGSSWGAIKIWDAETGAETLSIQSHVTDTIWSVAFHRDGKFLTSESGARIVQTWDLETGDCISTCEGPIEWTNEIAVSPKSPRRAARCSPDDDIIHIVDCDSGTEVLTLQGHSEQITSAAFSPDGRLIASGSEDKTVKIWDAVTGYELLTLQGHTWPVCSVCFSPDSRRIASGSDDKTIRIWDLESSAKDSTFLGHFGHLDEVESVCLTLDGRRITSASRDGTVKIWDTKSRDNIRTLEYELGPKISVAASPPDGRRIAVAGHGETTFVVISDAESGATISTCGISCNGPLALSLHGYYVAAVWRRHIKIMDAEDGRHVSMLIGHRGNITSLAFSTKDYHIIASASPDGIIKIWNAVTGAEIATFDVGTEIYLSKFDFTGAFLGPDSPFPIPDSSWAVSSRKPPIKFVTPEIRHHGYGVGMDGPWITWHGQKLLWIPPEFRPPEHCAQESVDVLPHMISIGCPSGRVWWITFCFEHHHFALQEQIDSLSLSKDTRDSINGTGITAFDLFCHLKDFNRSSM